MTEDTEGDAKRGEGKPRGILEFVREQLERQGIDLDALGCCGPDDPRLKVVCVASGLKESKQEMEQATRDQVVMVRVDAETSKALDAWVETGAVKSRSEAAALFIREGLKVRAAELDQLRDALHEVDQAKQRLRERARDVFGGDE